MTDLPTRPHRLRFSLAGVMGAVALVALACRWPILTFPAGAALAYGAAGARGTPPRAGDWRCLGLTTAAVYLPVAAGWFLLDCSHCRGTWLRISPAVPGMLPTLLTLRAAGLPRPSDDGVALASAVSLAMTGGLTLLGRRGALWQAAVVVAGLGSSCLATWVMVALVRA